MVYTPKCFQGIVIVGPIVATSHSHVQRQRSPPHGTETLQDLGKRRGGSRSSGPGILFRLRVKSGLASRPQANYHAIGEHQSTSKQSSQGLSRQAAQEDHYQQQHHAPKHSVKARAEAVSHLGQFLGADAHKSQISIQVPAVIAMRRFSF